VTTRHRTAMNRRRTVIRHRDEFRQVLTGEHRALQADLGTAGGYLIPPGEVYDQLLQQEADASVMRAICRVLPPTEAEEVPVPSQEAAMADAAWSTELTGGVDDTTASFGQRVLHPHPISKRVKVSGKLLRTQPLGERWVIEALGNAIATPQEAAFFWGSGAGEPFGLTVDPDVPIYTTAVSGNLSGDDIRKWLFSLPARYHVRARIVTTEDFLRHVLTLKDGSGDYLFPDYRGQLLGFPVVLSDGMPAIVDSSDVLVAGDVAAIVGDFSWYWIQDNAQIEIQRLAELYAEDGEIGFQARQETDGMPVIPTAFYLLKIKS